MKRLLSLSLFLMTAMLSFAHDFEVKNADGKTIYYNITSSSDLTVAVTYRGTSYKYSNGYTGAVTIPATVTYNGKTYSVTSIGDHAFYECRGLTSVTIPNSVTNIGGSAFWNCSGLTSVTIPNSVTSTGSYAFYGTAWYDNQPNGLVYAGKVAYEYKGTMPSNTKIALKEGTLGIGDYAFRNCSGLTSITIPNSVTNIGGSAFDGCSGLTSITIPNSVTSIGWSAFSGCSGLTKVIVPDIAAWCNISFGNYAANPLYYAKHIYSDENTEITDLVIPNSVTTIGDYAFYNYCCPLKLFS